MLCWCSLISTGRAVHEFAVTIMPAIYMELASHGSPCGLHINMYLAGLTFRVGGHPDGVKTPLAHHVQAYRHIIYIKIWQREC